jgi:hypothetical protein
MLAALSGAIGYALMIGLGYAIEVFVFEDFYLKLCVTNV